MEKSEMLRNNLSGFRLLLMLLAFGLVSPVTSLAEPEAMGRVTGVFPESGIVVINGQKYMVSNNAQVYGRIDKESENPLKGLKSGMNVLYEIGTVNGQPVVSTIVVTGDE
jgi:hypothetical protein